MRLRYVFEPYRFRFLEMHSSCEEPLLRTRKCYHFTTKLNDPVLWHFPECSQGAFSLELTMRGVFCKCNLLQYIHPLHIKVWVWVNLFLDKVYVKLVSWQTTKTDDDLTKELTWLFTAFCAFFPLILDLIRICLHWTIVDTKTKLSSWCLSLVSEKGILNVLLEPNCLRYRFTIAVDRCERCFTHHHLSM